MRVLATVAALTSLMPAAARAQQASYGQYLLVIDDSGSMDRSDPRRLVVMASLALAGGLEDGDQVMAVGLNELAAPTPPGPAFVSPAELLPGRDGAEGGRALGGPRVERLAHHAGPTPCRVALERAKSILEAVASAGAPQTLLLLTDGACNGEPVEAAGDWLGSLRAHREGRFRFVLLTRRGPEEVDPRLEEYARQTGWTGDSRVAFDARALLRAFADVLSFSRGLRYDDGGRIGLERTFAGARAVRVLAINEGGAERLELEAVQQGRGVPMGRGPTFRHPEHQFSLRVTEAPRSSHPLAVRSPTAGTEVLVIPVYGPLEIEAVIAPCDDPPPLPWTTERIVRAGQPACAWSRLIGQTGATIVPGLSFDFEMQICTDAACADATAMQPSGGGAFHAQLGTDIPSGRQERTFRARGGALALPVVARRGFAAVSFGVSRVSLASDPTRSIGEIDLGVLPKPVSDEVELLMAGSFPSGASARVRCEVEGDPATARCVSCVPGSGEIALADPFRVQVRVAGAPFCEPISSAGGRDLPIRMRLVVEPDGRGEGMAAHTVPMRALLRYAPTRPIEITLEAGSTVHVDARVPAPVAPEEVTATITLEEDDVRVEPGTPRERMRAGDDRTATRRLVADADSCCDAATYEGRLVLTGAGESRIELPLRVTVTDPGFWVCPGRQLLGVLLALLFLAFLVWVVRGFTSPARFRDGALVLWADSHDRLLKLRDGDDGWRELRRFPETARGFRRPAALHLGGPRAPLPSLKRMPDDGRIEARPGGGAVLVVRGPGVERFDESKGWHEVPIGEHPVPNRITLRRGEDLYLQFRS